MAKHERHWVQQPSWWFVIIGGSLFVIFSVAIIREIMNGHQVRVQVERLRNQVAQEEERQRQLQDLIDYLASPTFQEQEARLKLGLKKGDEQVIVVPTSGDAANVSTSQPETTVTTGQPESRPQRWWKYFFAPRSSTSSPTV